MDRFSLFLESKSLSLSMVIPFVSAIINNVQDEHSMLVFADYLQDTGDNDLIYVAEGIRKMLNGNPYSSGKKDHNDLLSYHNKLVTQIYRFFERLDQMDDPKIDAEHGSISWLSHNGWRTIDCSDPKNIRMIADQTEKSDPGENFKKFLTRNPGADQVLARFLVLMVVQREANSWTRRSGEDGDSRMAGIALYNLHMTTYMLLSSWNELSSSDLKKISDLFAEAQKGGAGTQALAKEGTFLIQIVNQLAFQDRAGPLAQQFLDLGERYGGEYE